MLFDRSAGTFFPYFLFTLLEVFYNKLKFFREVRKVTRFGWQEIVIVLLVVWAIYHTVMEMAQDKRIQKLEEQQKQ
jgi:energy-coupling factor transporter transmembrane protein EcfT